MKTFFNLLGPLLNPANVSKQLTGVYSPEVFELYSGFSKILVRNLGLFMRRMAMMKFR